MPHALCAIGHRLVESGRSVIFTPAYRLVQDLPAAKRDFWPCRVNYASTGGGADSRSHAAR